MKKLKNWFVRFETIKGGAAGLVNMADYIYDNKHANHVKKGHEIISYEQKSEIILKNILYIQQKKDNEIMLKRKGGRPASFGKSLLISFPPEIKLTNDNARNFRNALVDGLIEFISQNNNLNYTKEQIVQIKTDFILSSLHRQAGNNDHLNIIIPNVFLDLNQNKALKRIDLGKKMYSHFLKNMTNKLLLQLGHNYLDYQIRAQRSDRNRQNKLNYTLDKIHSEIKQLQDVFREMDFLKDISSKIEKRIAVYLNRMQTAIEENDKEKFEKNIELANTSYNKLKLLTNDKHLEKLEKFEALKKSISEKKIDSFVSSYPNLKRY